MVMFESRSIPLSSDCWLCVFDHLKLDDLLSASCRDPSCGGFKRQAGWPAIYRKARWWTDDENLGAYNTDKQIVSCDEFKDVVARAQAVVDEARFPDAAMWKKVLQDGNAYAFVGILLSQLHNLCALRLDFAFVWKSNFPGLILKHAHFTAPKGRLSTFKSLAFVDYGSNVPIPPDSKYVDGGYVDGHPSCEPGQFMAWFYLPSLRTL